MVGHGAMEGHRDAMLVLDARALGKLKKVLQMGDVSGYLFDLYLNAKAPWMRQIFTGFVTYVHCQAVRFSG